MYRDFNFLSCIAILIVFLCNCSSQENKVNRNRLPEEIDSLFKLTNFNDIFFLEKIELQYSDSSIISRISTATCVDENGMIYVGQSNSCHVLVFDGNGKFVRRIGKKGKGPGELLEVNSIDVRHGKVYVLGDLNVSIFTEKGDFLKRFQYGNEFAPHIHTTSDGKIIIFYTCAMTNKMCEVFDGEGNLLKRWGEFPKESRTSYGGRVSSAVDDHNNVYSINFYDKSVFKFDINGKLLTRFPNVKPFIEHDISRIANANNPKDVFLRTLEGTIMEGVYRLKFKNYGLIIVETVKIDPAEMKFESRNIHIFNEEGRFIKNISIPKNLNIIHANKKDLYATYQDGKTNKESFDDSKNPLIVRISLRDSLTQNDLN